MESLNKHFNNKVEEMVKNELQWKLNNNTPPGDSVEGYYYFINNNLDSFTEIFKEIKNGKFKRQLNVTESSLFGMLYAHFDNDINKMLMGIKINSDTSDSHKKEFKRLMNLMVENKELKGMVKRHKELVAQSHNNKERKKFNESIIKLHDDIVIDSKYIEGKCDECGFRKLMYLKFQ